MTRNTGNPRRRALPAARSRGSAPVSRPCRTPRRADSVARSPPTVGAPESRRTAVNPRVTERPINPGCRTTGSGLRCGWPQSLRSCCGPSHGTPGQGVIQLAGILQLADFLQANERGAQEFLGSGLVLAIRRVDFLYALAHGPARIEVRQSLANLVALDAVVAGIGTGVAGEGHFRSRHHLAHHLRDLTHAIVLFGQADIKGLVVDELARRFENRHKGA